MALFAGIRLPLAAAALAALLAASGCVDIVGAIVSMFSLVVLLKFWQPKHTWQFDDEKKDEEKDEKKEDDKPKEDDPNRPK